MPDAPPPAGAADAADDADADDGDDDDGDEEVSALPRCAWASLTAFARTLRLRPPSLAAREAAGVSDDRRRARSLRWRLLRR